jgi:hypothetical protein
MTNQVYWLASWPLVKSYFHFERGRECPNVVDRRDVDGIEDLQDRGYTMNV